MLLRNGATWVLDCDTDRPRAQTSFTGEEASRFHDSSFLHTMKCEADTRKELYANVVSSGGTAIFKGTEERMTKELTALATFTMMVLVVAPPE